MIKNCYCDQEKKIEITRAIYLNNERSVQFSKQNAFLKLVPEGFADLIHTLEQIEFKLKRKKWYLETYGKSWKIYHTMNSFFYLYLFN